MPYKAINWKHIEDKQTRKVIKHADMMLRDVYAMFKLPIDKESGEGSCNFSILVILLVIIDGLAVYIYPKKEAVDDQEKRFKKLIRDKLYWGPPDKGWIEKGLAAKQFYLELRNPLVHELGADKPTNARQKGHNEPIIGKWAKIPEGYRNIDYIEGLEQWNDDWPLPPRSGRARARRSAPRAGR